MFQLYLPFKYLDFAEVNREGRIALHTHGVVYSDVCVVPHIGERRMISPVTERVLVALTILSEVHTIKVLHFHKINGIWSRKGAYRLT